MTAPLTRRALLVRSAAVAVSGLLAARGEEIAGSRRQAANSANVSLIVSAKPANDVPVRTEEFGTVGVFDVDWLADPSFTPLLDNFAASPGAFTAVRFFGALNSGTKEKTMPTESGQRTGDSEQPTHSFTSAFAGLEALTARGLIPFVQLSFFPASVSPSPIVPPASFDRWQRLVRDFLDALVADPRFGREAIKTWWFEVWNEPNIPVFWGDTFDHYLDLYRATSAAVRAGGYPIRLGGPALAWLPATDGAAGEPLMRRFLQFLRDEPDVQCDFLSFHQKGTWVNPAQGDAEPVLGDLISAADTTARMALAMVPGRCRNLPIINNEADMKVGFDLPYEPRMTERFPTWLASLLVASDGLSTRYRDSGLRFHAAADNANLQLVQTPFDGRRAVMTRAAPTPTATSDLLKLPVYHFYELLRLLGNRRGTVIGGADACYPNSDLFHLLTVGEEQMGALFARYPTDAATAQPYTVDYTIADIPWERVNIARFQIDATLSNAYTAAGGRLSPPPPDAAAARMIRQVQELTLFAPIQQDMALVGGTFHDHVTIAPFATLLYWITPTRAAVPAAPGWVAATMEEGNVILRWEASREASFFSYQVSLAQEGAPDLPLSPLPLRSAQWIDTAPPSGTRRYRVRAMSASGISGPAVLSDQVVATGG